MFFFGGIKFKFMLRLTAGEFKRYKAGTEVNNKQRLHLPAAGIDASLEVYFYPCH